MRKIFGIFDVPCPVCGARTNEQCKPVRRDHNWLYASVHAERAWDAQDVQNAYAALSGGDDDNP